MALSSINVSYAYQITYDNQGVQISTTSSCIFLSKSSISSISNNVSSLSIIFHGSPSTFYVSSSQNYLITNIYNGLTNQGQHSNDHYGSDSDSE